MTAASCPRCGGLVHPASAWSSAWHCDQHGEIYPLRQISRLSPAGLAGLLKKAAVPCWLPWPLPAGWVVTGFASAGDDRSGVRGCAVALSGPNPVGGPGELLLVSEEMGVGLGARCAGLEGPDPGAGFAAGPPHAQVGYLNHDFPCGMWTRPAARPSPAR